MQIDMYYDYKNRVLKNRMNIKNSKTLEQLEYILVGFRLAQASQNEIYPELNMEIYQKIHYHLFRDIYEWAGEYRKINISKGKTLFLPFKYFENAEKELDIQIKRYLYPVEDNEELALKKLAKIIIDLNYMHPFREGNGRTQREFIRQLAYKKGFSIGLNHIKLYMMASVKDDKELMYDYLIKNLYKH